MAGLIYSRDLTACPQGVFTVHRRGSRYSERSSKQNQQCLVFTTLNFPIQGQQIINKFFLGHLVIQCHEEESTGKGMRLKVSCAMLPGQAGEGLFLFEHEAFVWTRWSDYAQRVSWVWGRSGLWPHPSLSPTEKSLSSSNRTHNSSLPEVIATLSLFCLFVCLLTL